jgi:hypothetical protein
VIQTRRPHAQVTAGRRGRPPPSRRSRAGELLDAVVARPLPSVATPSGELSWPLPVPDGTPHFRRNVHGGIVVVVVPKMVVVVEVEVVVVVWIVFVVEVVVLVVVEVVVVLVVEVVVVLVVEVVVLVVELVVVVVAPTGQRGRPGSPVQVQERALHWSITLLSQLLEGWGPHASLISSLQAVTLSHLPLLSAIAEEETKTPTPSATAAKNVTTAFLVIVEPPMAVPTLEIHVPRPLPAQVARLRHGCRWVS